MHELGFEHLHMTPERQQSVEDAVWSQDNIQLVTVGIDVGSSTSHLMFARVHLRRMADRLSSRFAVLEREILWRSPILLTPYRDDDTIDADGLKAFFDRAFAEAGFTPENIDTGAVILTGEALKRANARAIADLFAAESGKFVCATAGHNLEAMMAAHGSGAVALSRQTQKTILNVDIGGGTVKLGLCRNGRLLSTAAFAIGGRLIAVDGEDRMARIDGPAVLIAADAGLDLRKGDLLSRDDRRTIAKRMAQAIADNINRTAGDPLCRALALTPPLPADGPAIDALTFSGGVSEFLYGRETQSYGDLGGALAHQLSHALGDRRIPHPVYDPGQGIRATVAGAAQFAMQVSGSTIFVSDPDGLPIRNVPVARLDIDLSGDFTAADVSAGIGRALQRLDRVEGEDQVAIALRWGGDPLHARLHALADGICRGLPHTVEDARNPLIVLMDGDAGRTLGSILVNEFDVPGEVISIDSVQLREFDFVDIGSLVPETQVVPLIVKSLLFPAPGS